MHKKNLIKEQDKSSWSEVSFKRRTLNILQFLWFLFSARSVDDDDAQFVYFFYFRILKMKEFTC